MYIKIKIVLCGHASSSAYVYGVIGIAILDKTLRRITNSEYFLKHKDILSSGRSGTSAVLNENLLILSYNGDDRHFIFTLDLNLPLPNEVIATTFQDSSFNNGISKGDNCFYYTAWVLEDSTASIIHKFNLNHELIWSLKVNDVRMFIGSTIFQNDSILFNHRRNLMKVNTNPFENPCINSQLLNYTIVYKNRKIVKTDSHKFSVSI